MVKTPDTQLSLEFQVAEPVFGEREDPQYDIGYNRGSDPEINAGIRAIEWGLGTKILNPGILRSIARAAFLRNPRVESSDLEIRRKLSKIKSLGWRLEPYSHLSGNDLHRYYNREIKKIGVLAEKICPEELAEIEEEQDRRIKEIYHY